MSKQTMSITQGLAELKLLDRRMEHPIVDMTLVEVRTTKNQFDVEKFKQQALSDYQSYTDLIKRRDSIKRAIVNANAVTKVKVGSWEGTVAEAIEQKRSICYQENLLEKMREQLKNTRAQFDEQQQQVDSRLERLLQSELGKDVKTSPDTINALTTSFRANNKVELVDPLDLESKISALLKEIETFKTNVDWVLSEANGRTMIDV